MPRHWIFQANPDQFDVDRYIQARREIVWTVRQHKDHILSGDRVFIWRSGTKAGVVAECIVVAPPSAEILEDAPELWKERPRSQTGEVRCKLRVVDSFVDAAISRAAIRSALPDLSIVKAPQGTNFNITESDYEAILSLKDAVTVSLPFDASALSAALRAIEATHMRVERGILESLRGLAFSKAFCHSHWKLGNREDKARRTFCRVAIWQRPKPCLTCSGRS